MKGIMHYANKSFGRRELLRTMPFHFKKREPVAKAVRRMCRERLEGALKTLQRSDRLKGVHNVRKEIKKLRAIFRLMRGEIGNKIYRRNNQALRAAAAGLTAMRDAQVKLNAFESLTKHFNRRLSARPFPKIKKALKKNCRATERKFLKGRSAASVGKILRALKEDAADLKTDSKGWAAISPGFTRSYCRGQEALKAVHREASPENLHEWRKRVKDLGYHLRLLCHVWPRKLPATTDEMEKLGELLGDDHDLVMLAEFVRKKFKKAGEATNLCKLIGQRQKELRAEALKIGERFYAEKPLDFCRRIGDYWKIWRGKKV